MGFSATMLGPIEAATFSVDGIAPAQPASTIVGFDPTGRGGIGTASLIFSANPGKSMPVLNIVGAPQDGTGEWFFLICDASNNAAKTPRIQMPSALEIYPVTPSYPDQYQVWIGQNPDAPPSKGMYLWAQPSANVIDLQGQTVGGAYDQKIRINPQGGNIELALQGNAAVGNLNISGTTTLGADPTQPLQAATKQYVDSRTGSMVYPAAGVAVSTGNAWGTSIPQNNIPLLNAPTNAFTGNLVVGPGTALSFPEGTIQVTSKPGSLDNCGIVISRAAKNVYASLDILDNASLSTGFAMYLANDNTDNLHFYDRGAGRDWLTVTQGTDNVAFYGNISSNGTITAFGNVQLGASAGSAATNPAVLSDGNNLFLNSNPSGAVYINWDRGNNGVKFCDGAEHVVASIAANGAMSISFAPQYNYLAQANQDWNTLTQPGFFFMNSSQPNAPASSDPRGFLVMVIGDTSLYGGSCYQLAFNFNITGEVWTRQYSFSAWHPWFSFNVTQH